MSNSSAMTADDQQPIATNIVSATPIESNRIQSLDVLRGIAVLGALFITIWVFGGLSNNKQIQLQLHPHGISYRLYATIILFLEGKMLSLISLVFGTGLVLFMLKSRTKDRLPVADFFIRRQMWLIALGLINALLFLSTGDVLFHLGIMGILLFPFIRLSRRGLLVAAIVTALIFSGKNYWSYADDHKAYKKYLVAAAIDKKIVKDSLDKRKTDSLTRLQKGVVVSSAVKKDTLTTEQKEDKEKWEGMIKSMKYDPKKDEGYNKSMHALEFGKLWDHLLPNTQSKEAQWTYRTGIWDLATMMFLGMALFKFGFFSHGFSRKYYLLLAIAGITAGILLGLFRMYYGTTTLMDYAKYISRYWLPYDFFFPFEKAFMVLGYASLIIFLLPVRLLAGVWKALAAAGRLSLTNYLLQSIICALFFTGYGMGYFGRLQQYQLYAVAAEICIVQVVFSILWLRAFKYGPAEWLWRCLIYWKWISLKAHKAPTTSINTAPIS